MSIEVVARMEDVRLQRLEQEAIAIMPQRWAVLESAGHQLLERQFARRPELLAYGMNVADLALQREFRALMCSPIDTSNDTAAVLELDGQMDEIADSWTEHIRATLHEMVVKAKVVTKRSQGVDPLDLAMITFGPKKASASSKWCGFFPSVVGRHIPRTGLESGTTLSPYEEFVYAKSPGPFRDAACRHIYVRKPTHLARTVIKMAKLKADTATATEMDALDLRWLDSDNRIYTWREIVSVPKTLESARGLIRALPDLLPLLLWRA